MISAALSVTGVALAFYAASTYVRLILAGHIKPHRITWGGWTLAGILGLWASFDGGAQVGLIVPGAITLLVAATFVLSLMPKYGKAGGDKLDYIFGTFAAAGIIAWRVFDFSPALAATIAVISDGVFLWPTLREAWRHPEEEDIKPWAIGTVAEFLGVLALGTYTFAAAAYPIYILLGNLAIAWALLIQGNRRVTKKH